MLRSPDVLVSSFIPSRTLSGRKSSRRAEPKSSMPYGVYQIGEVYARSATVIGVPGSGFVP